MNQESFRESIPHKKLPEYWTVLYHGSNLSRPEWQGEEGVLNSDTLIVGRGGLSMVTEEARSARAEEHQYLRQEGIATSNGNTTDTYSMNVGDGESRPLEIQILFPAFNNQARILQEAELYYSEKYGDRFKQILEMSNGVYYQNRQQGRHPLLPRGMVLRKINTVIEGEKTVIQYVPSDLFDIYEAEIAE